MELEMCLFKQINQLRCLTNKIEQKWTSTRDLISQSFEVPSLSNCLWQFSHFMRKIGKIHFQQTASCLILNHLGAFSQINQQVKQPIFQEEQENIQDIVKETAFQSILMF